MDLQLIEECKNFLRKSNKFDDFLNLIKNFKEEYSKCQCNTKSKASDLFCVNPRNDFSLRVNEFLNKRNDFFAALEEILLPIISNWVNKNSPMEYKILDEVELNSLSSIVATAVFSEEYIKADRDGLMLNANCYQNKLIVELEKSPEWNVNMKKVEEVQEKPPCFELSSGIYKQDFLTIWPIFEGSRLILFNRIINGLTEIALREYKRKPFRTIVTCTDTAKELVLHIQPLLQEKIREFRPVKQEDSEYIDEINVSHRGHYPGYSISELDNESFHGSNVLIITDVVASGKLIKLMAESVFKMGADDVSILTLALTAEKDDTSQTSLPEERIIFEDDIPKIIVNSGEERKRIVQFLTYIPVEMISKASDYSSYKIGHTSIYPEIPEDFFGVDDQKSLFPVSQMFEHLEKINALDFGLYHGSGMEYSNSINPDILFGSEIASEVRDQIWGEIQKAIENFPKNQQSADLEKIIISTYRREDIQFRDFIKAKYDFELKNVNSITIKQEIHVTPFTTKIYLPHLVPVSNKWAVVLLSFVNSTDILGNIISTIAEYAPARITIICLINRLGIQTENFVQRIKQLLKGRSPDATKTEHIHFDFISIYSINEFSREDWYNERLYVDNVISKFKRSTRVLSFRRLTDHLYRKFISRTFGSTYWSVEQKQWEHKDTFDVLLKQVQTNKEEKKEAYKILYEKTWIVYSTFRVANLQDYTLLIKHLENTWLRRGLHFIVAILLTQIDFIRTHYQPNSKLTIFSVCIKTIIDRIKKLRKTRFDYELQSMDDDSSKVDKINDIIKLEVDYIAGLGLLSHSDRSEHYNKEFIFGLYDHELSLNKWVRHPINLKLHFSEERIGWSVTFLIHGLYHNFSSQNFSHPDKEKLKNSLLNWKDIFKNPSDKLKEILKSQDDENSAITLARQCENNIDRVLEHIGFYRTWTKHQLIRFLQFQIISQPDRHNTIHVSLENLYRHINNLLRKATKDIPYEFHSSFLIKITKEVEQYLDVALNSLSLLETLIPSIHNLMLFTPIKRDENFRFVDISDERGFAFDVIQLQSELLNIKQSSLITDIQGQLIGQLRTKINFDLFNAKSPLYTILTNYYITTIEENLLNNLINVREKFKKLEKYEGVFDKEIAKIESLLNDKNPKLNFALIDSRLLNEVFDNVLYNLRHTFIHNVSKSKNRHHKRQNRKNPSIEIEIITMEDDRPFTFQISEAENEPLEGIKIIIKGYGNQVSFIEIKEDSSILREQQDVANYGGILKMENLEDGKVKGTITTLILISRNKLKTENKKYGI